MCAFPVVSVIIPTHNCLKWLPGAIESIGPRQDIEIIVFDDASTDGTAEWLEKAASQDARLVAMRGLGVGPSKARNQAIAIARAPLLAFLDADDRWYPGKLAVQLALHAQWPEVGFSFTNYRHVTEVGEDRGTCFEYWRRFRRRAKLNSAPFALGGDAMAQLFAENVVGTSTVVVQTALMRSLGGLSEDLPSSEDWDMWLRLAQRAPVMCVPDVFVDYMLHRAGSETGKMRARALATRMIGARHQDAVRKVSGAAVRVFMSRLMEADAEIAQKTGEPLGDLGCRIAAWFWAPSRRTTRELVGALGRAVRRRRRRLPAASTVATAGAA